MTDLTIQPDEIDWRVGATYDGRDGKMAMLLGYIDARLAMEKLDALDANWSSHIEVIRLADKDGIRCSLTVNGVTREDVGTASDTEPLKGAVSDALKRAAVHFGIGRELYDLPSIGVQVEVKANGKAGKPKALPVWNKDRWTIDSKYGWVKYDHEPTEPGRGERERGLEPSEPATTPGPSIQAVVARIRERMTEHGIDFEGISAILKKDYGDRRFGDMAVEELIALGTDIAHGKYDAPDELPDIPPTPDEVVAAVVEATGGEEIPLGEEALAFANRTDKRQLDPVEDIPPEPGSDEYKALPANEKAAAKAYWATQAPAELAALA